MKILNISSIIPLKGLQRENDIIVVIQDYLRDKYDYEFMVAKALPYANKFLARIKKKWRTYHEYQQQGVTEVLGYKTLVYPWLALPTSNFLVNYLLLPLNWILFNILLLKKFAKWAKEADLFLAQNTIPDGVLAYWLSKKYSKPYVLTFRANFNPFRVPFVKSVFENSSSIITPSPANYINLKHSVDIKFMPHPVDSIFFGDDKKNFSFIRLISVCRLLDWKHLNWVINVLASLNEKGYTFEYHIVGDGPELGHLKTLTRKHKLNERVFFHGYLNHTDISKLLKASHIFIMPSFPETFGMAFIEAAASNCLCIGHKNTGVDGLFKHSKSALFVDQTTIMNEMEMLFRNFSADYIEPYIKNARHIVDQLTWENIGSKYHEVYSNALKKALNV